MSSTGVSLEVDWRKSLCGSGYRNFIQSEIHCRLPEGGVTSRPFSKLENAGTEKLCDNERSSSASDIWEQSMLDAAPRTSDEEQLLGEFTDAVNSELKKIVSLTQTSCQT